MVGARVGVRCCWDVARWMDGRARGAGLSTFLTVRGQVEIGLAARVVDDTPTEGGGCL